MAINKAYDDVQLDVEFTQASTRANLVSKENISVSFGKISKYFADLHSQAFTGYTHPTHTAHSSGLYKITVDGLGHVTAAATVTGSDLPAHEHPYLPLAGGTLTGRVTTSKFLNYVVKGTGTAGADKGSGQNPRYVPAKWTFNTGQTVSDGDVIIIKIPVAGHDYGVYISIDNGTTYHPVVLSGSSRLTTHYGNGNYAAFTFRSDGSAASMIPLAGNTDGTRVTVTGGVWQGIDYYDSGNTYDRTSQQTRIYAGGVGVFRYSICGLNSAQRMESFTTTGDASGSPTTTKTFNTSAKFSYPPVIMYNNANAVYSNGNAIGNNVLYEQFPSLDMRYSCNKTSSASTGFTQYKPVFIECIFDDNGFWSITSNGFVQTFTSGKYYILVGCMYNTSVYQLAMFAQHPVYYYDGTNLTMVPFTKAEKTKLAGISEGANKTEASSTNGKIKIDGTDTTVYTHPSYTSKTSGLYKITVDSTGHVSSTASVAKGDIPALDYLPLAGGSLSGSMNFKSTTYDGSAANNGVSSGISYPTTFNILDKSSRILVRLEGVINSSGSIGSYWYVKNYNTSGTQVNQKGISMTMAKDGTLTYTVSDGAKFRSAIGAGTSSLTIGTTSTTAAAGDHAHGLLHSNLTQAASNGTTGGWSVIGIDPAVNGYVLKSIRINQTSPNWLSGDFGAGIAFGGSDTKGVISMKYDSPVITFAGGNHKSSKTEPVWYLKISGTSGSTYNLDNLLSTTLLKVSESTNLMLDGETNAFGYVSGLTKDTWNFQQTDGTIIRQRYSTLWKTEIFMDYRTGQMSTRGKNKGTWQDWRIHLDSGNYTSYTVTKTGSGASGTWGISITGNASTSTKATQDGNGNTISSTYLKLSGGKMAGTIQGTSTNTHIALAGGGIGDYATLDHKNNINISSWYGVSISNGCSNAGTLDQVTFSVNARTGTTQQRGHAILYSASGDSPALIFQRGTFVDNLNDWKIYVSGGELRFAQSTANASSETWTTKMYFHASDGNLYVGSTKVSLNGHTHNYAGSSSAGGPATNVAIARVSKDSKVFPGANKVVFEEYTNGGNYNLPGNDYYHIMSAQGNDTNYGTQLALGMTATAAYYRVYNNKTWSDWKSLINTDTTYSANNGVGLSGTTFYNSGVRAVSTGSANGTISVNTNGTTGDVAVKGLGSAAYTESSDYVPKTTVSSSTDADTLFSTTQWVNWNTATAIKTTHMPTANYGLLLVKASPGPQVFFPDTGTGIYLRKKAANSDATAWMGITGNAGATYNLSNFYKSTTSRTANTVLAAPNGSNGAATFRKLVAADIPDLSGTYLPTAGTTINNPNTSSVSFTNGMSGNILFTNTGDTNGVARGIGGIVGGTDSWSVRGYQTATNKGCLEISVGDDGDEGIYVRQYTSGAFKATFSNNAGSASGLTYRELVLMAPSTGASVFPSTINTAGNITITKASGDTGFYATRSDTSVTVWMGVGSGGTNHGVYSNKLGKWMMYGDASNVYLNGNAATATKATQDGNGNTISSTYLKLSGGTMTGELKQTTQLRIYHGNYGAIIRSDGCDTYFLVTDSGSAASGSWNSLRPFAFSNSTGLVSMGNGAKISSSGYGALSIIRTADNNAGIKFYNNTSTYLGSIAIATVNGTFHRFKTDESTMYEIIDRSVVRNNTTVGTLGWKSSSADTVIPTVNTIAYWNGAYSGTSSNLAYCNKGAFGTIVTKSTTDYSKVSISRNLTSGTKVGTIKIDGTATDLYCQTNSDTKVTQNIASGSAKRPLLMSYYQTGTTTTSAQVVYRNDSIYANPSTGTIHATTFDGNITTDAFHNAIYALGTTSDTATFDGAETLITSLPSASGTSTPSYKRTTLNNFIKNVIGNLKEPVLYENTSTPSKSATVRFDTTLGMPKYLKLFIVVCGSTEYTTSSSVTNIVDIDPSAVDNGCFVSGGSPGQSGVSTFLTAVCIRHTVSSVNHTYGIIPGSSIGLQPGSTPSHILQSLWLTKIIAVY